MSSRRQAEPNPKIPLPEFAGRDTHKMSKAMRVKTESKAGRWRPGEIHQDNNSSNRREGEQQGGNPFHNNISAALSFVETLRVFKNAKGMPDIVLEESVWKNLKVFRTCSTKGHCRSWMEEAPCTWNVRLDNKKLLCRCDLSCPDTQHHGIGRHTTRRNSIEHFSPFRLSAWTTSRVESDVTAPSPSVSISVKIVYATGT